jgi:hypothetical protein
MEWKSSKEKLDAYVKCARQAARLPNWLQGTTDYFGKNYDPQQNALNFILDIARKDSWLSLDDLATLNEEVKKLYSRYDPLFLWDDV